jgi:hypothetical protein
MSPENLDKINNGIRESLKKEKIHPFEQVVNNTPQNPYEAAVSGKFKRRFRAIQKEGRLNTAGGQGELDRLATDIFQIGEEGYTNPAHNPVNEAHDNQPL